MSHLFFADDLVLFVKADMKNCINVLDALEGFCGISRQKINKEKSRVYFSPNVDGNKREELCEVLGFRSTPKLGKYLGFPLKQPGSRGRDFDFIVERVQAKLAGWKGHLLSFAGKVVLAQSVLTTILTYIMQNTMLPSRTLEALDRVTKNFIWGSTQDKRKVQMVGWNRVTKPKEGGLGLQAAKQKNLSLLAKLNWRFRKEKDKDWAKVLCIKYNNPKRNGSNLWSGMKRGGHVFMQGVKWKVGTNSTLNFWNDRWLTVDNLRGMIEGLLRRDEELLSVKDLRNEGRWDFSRCSFDLPGNLISLLKAVPIPMNHQGEDWLVWASPPSEEFEQKNAYRIARGDCEPANAFEGKWCQKLKLSFGSVSCRAYPWEWYSRKGVLCRMLNAGSAKMIGKLSCMCLGTVYLLSILGES